MGVVHSYSVPPYMTPHFDIMRHLARVANVLSGVRSGLMANSKIETLSKFDSIVFVSLVEPCGAKNHCCAHDPADGPVSLGRALRE